MKLTALRDPVVLFALLIFLVEALVLLYWITFRKNRLMLIAAFTVAVIATVLTYIFFH